MVNAGEIGAAEAHRDAAVAVHHNHVEEVDLSGVDDEGVALVDHRRLHPRRRKLGAERATAGVEPVARKAVGVERAGVGGEDLAGEFEGELIVSRQLAPPALAAAKQRFGAGVDDEFGAGIIAAGGEDGGMRRRQDFAFVGPCRGRRERRAAQR